MNPLTIGKKKNNKVAGMKKVAGVGSGVKSIKMPKKAKFSSESLTEFKSETNLIGTFPSNENTVKSKKKKSLIDEAKEVVTNKDQLPQKVKGKLKDK